jgi:CRISPR system Cascade subunit CasB
MSAGAETQYRTGQTRLSSPVALVADGEIGRLQRGVLKDVPTAVGAVARLRRAAGKDAVATPDLWGLIDLESLFATESGLTERDRERAEKAIYAAVTLWSLHQQSQGEPMHSASGPSNLGAAVHRLMRPGELDDPLRKRLVRAGAAPGLPQLTVRLREIIQLLRRESVSLDYALLADQLYRWQQPGGPTAVRRDWGRAFHAYRPPTDKNSTAAGQTDSDRKEAAP